MSCSPFQPPLGGGGFVCGPRREPPCSVQFCGRPRTKLCDWKVAGGTCDSPLCDAHATQPARGKDLCPAHAKVWEERLASKAAGNAP